MKAFVAGATGYTGRYVVEELCARGDEVTAHIRPGSSSMARLGPHFAELGARVEEVDWEPAALGEALERFAPDLVFCLIGTTRARRKELEASGGDGQTATYEAVDYGLTRMLVDVCADLSKKPLFVYLSSMGVSPNGINAYMKARYKAEQAVIEAATPHLIARSAIITGDDRDDSRLGEQLGGKVNDLFIKTLGALGARDLERKYRSTSGAELARALVRLATTAGSQDQIVEAQWLKDDSPLPPWASSG